MEFAIHIQLEPEQYLNKKMYYWQLSISEPYKAERNIAYGWEQTIQQALTAGEKAKKDYLKNNS